MRVFDLDVRQGRNLKSEGVVGMNSINFTNKFQSIEMMTPSDKANTYLSHIQKIENQEKGIKNSPQNDY